MARALLAVLLLSELAAPAASQVTTAPGLDPYDPLSREALHLRVFRPPPSQVRIDDGGVIVEARHPYYHGTWKFPEWPGGGQIRSTTLLLDPNLRPPQPAVSLLNGTIPPAAARGSTEAEGRLHRLVVDLEGNSFTIARKDDESTEVLQDVLVKQAPVGPQEARAAWVLFDEAGEVFVLAKVVEDTLYPWLPTYVRLAVIQDADPSQRWRGASHRAWINVDVRRLNGKEEALGLFVVNQDVYLVLPERVASTDFPLRRLWRFPGPTPTLGGWTQIFGNGGLGGLAFAWRDVDLVTPDLHYFRDAPGDEGRADPRDHGSLEGGQVEVVSGPRKSRTFPGNISSITINVRVAPALTPGPLSAALLSRTEPSETTVAATSRAEGRLHSVLAQDGELLIRRARGGETVVAGDLLRILSASPTLAFERSWVLYNQDERSFLAVVLVREDWYAGNNSVLYFIVIPDEDPMGTWQFAGLADPLPVAWSRLEDPGAAGLFSDGRETALVLPLTGGEDDGGLRVFRIGSDTRQEDAPLVIETYQ